MNLGRYVTVGARRSPNRTALEIVGGSAQTYLELDRATNRIAHTLHGLGLRAGDRVSIWMRNSLEYVNTYVACLKAGFVIVQINIRHTAVEADFQLQDSGSSALVYDDEVADRVEGLQGLEHLRVVLALGRHRVPGSLDFTSQVARGSADPVRSSMNEDSLAVIGYTSGTTGYPKGVELTHQSIHNIGVTNIASNRYALASHQIFGMSLSFTSATPAHILPHLYVGGTTTLLSDWDTDRIVYELEARQATFIILPSPAIPEFIASARAANTTLPSLVSMLHSASKAPAEDLEALVDVFGTRLVEGWGMTENSGGLVAATTARDYFTRRPGIFTSTGRAVPDTEVRLIDEDGAPVPTDGESVGQLLVRSPSLARGYWRNPEATRSAFVDGWYHSGDLGTIDPDGYISVLDRRNDLIISGGMNVYPSEVERVLYAYPGIHDAVVVPVSHERWGQTPVAWIVASDGIDLDGVLQHCRTSLAGYKIPSRIERIEELPRNAGGKVLRHELRDRSH